MLTSLQCNRCKTANLVQFGALLLPIFAKTTRKYWRLRGCTSKLLPDTPEKYYIIILRVTTAHQILILKLWLQVTT
jgi:hypothetical protein